MQTWRGAAHQHMEVSHHSQPSVMTHDMHTNTSVQIRIVRQTYWSRQTTNTNTELKGHHASLCICARARDSVRCMPAGLRRLHHYISAWPAVRSAWDLLFYITALPFASLVGSPLALSSHHLLSTLQLYMLSTFLSLLCGFHCQPSLLSNFYWFTNAVRWSWLACTLHKQPARSHHSPLKNTPAPLSYT